MKGLADSDLVSKYGYIIVADAAGTILCKSEAVNMFVDLTSDEAEDIPPYQEDFSFLVKDNQVSLYLGDMYLLTLEKTELELVLKTLNSDEG